MKDLALKHYLICGLLIFILPASLFSQDPTPVLTQLDTLPPNQEDVDTTSGPVKVKNSDNFIAEVLDGVDIQYFRGNVRMFHDSVYMFADSAIIDNDNLTAIGEVIIVQDDTVNIFADQLKYNSESKMARLYDKVVLETDGKQLFTDYLLYDIDKKQGTFADTAILTRKTMTLSSLKGSYNVDTKRAFFHDQVVIIDEDFRLTCDSLDYDTDIDRAYFRSPTYITQGKKQIYCEDGYYDLEEKRAFFTDKAVIKEESQSASADNILISEQDSTMILRGAAIVEDSISRAEGEEIIFDNKTGDIQIIGNGRYQNDDNLIEGPYIFFNEKTEDLLTEGRSTVYDKKGNLTADTISYLKATDAGTALGSVVWRDTIEDRVLMSDRLDYSDANQYYKASVSELRPLLIQNVDGDSLYVSADTLISAKPADSLSYLRATNRVKIYKSDLQAICDSLYYSSVDSTFSLYGNPVCWSDTTQFIGDTIQIVLRNDKVSEIIARTKAFIATQQPGEYYDQIKGRYIHSFLDSNELKLMHINGNAEAIYLIKDDEQAYVGPNKTLCSHMTFFFEQSELDSIKFYAQPESQMTPMEKATDKDLKLEGFRWVSHTRPMSAEGIRERKQLAGRREESIPATIDSFETEIMNVIDKPMGEDLPKKGK